MENPICLSRPRGGASICIMCLSVITASPNWPQLTLTFLYRPTPRRVARAGQSVQGTGHSKSKQLDQVRKCCGWGGVWVDGVWVDVNGGERERWGWGRGWGWREMG
ncbi:hypothetical protein BaRGS_00033168 [Batillaria attramentaria]|uniref:Uncharacterized protein n=1 Tax=Batillaria attramentaria TaxID=370345 RepID=A0ABD0JKR6_9CAEN